MKQKFYEKTWFFILMCIFLPPVAIALLWVQKKSNKGVRIIGTILMAVWTLIIIISIVATGSASKDFEKGFSDGTSAAVSNTTPTSTPEASSPSSDSSEGIISVQSAIDKTNLKNATTTSTLKPDGSYELTVDADMPDYMAKSAVFNNAYDLCEYLKEYPKLAEEYSSVIINYNGDYVAQDGTTQQMPFARIRYTVEQINNFDFSSRDYTGFKNIADVVKMNID